MADRSESVVYLVTNRVNGKRYVGVTGNGLEFRRRQHEQAANARRVTCRAFHAAIRKYGADAFDWGVLVECSAFEEALQEETRLIAELKPEYNLTTGGQGTRGRLVSQAQREHQSRVMKGRKRSPESIAKMVATITGRKRSPEVKAKLSAAKLGKKCSPQHCINIGLSKRGFKFSPESIEKRRLKAIGRPCSPEHREKIRNSLIGRKRPPDVVARILATRAKTFAARRMEATRA